MALRLGKVLKNWRKLEDMTVRDAAHQIGISHVTLARIEDGESPGSVTFMKILNFVMTEIK